MKNANAIAENFGPALRKHAPRRGQLPFSRPRAAGRVLVLWFGLATKATKRNCLQSHRDTIKPTRERTRVKKMTLDEIIAGKLASAADRLNSEFRPST